MRRWRLLAVVSGACLLGGCGQVVELEPTDSASAPVDDTAATSTSAPDPETQTIALRLPADASQGSALSAGPVQSGTARVTVEVVSRDGGEVQVARGRDDELVLDFPAFDAQDQRPPRAVVRVTPAGGGADPLAPGDADFSFGAEFRIDAESKGTKVDNGDNLVQRGLASDPSQYKLELDGDRPACRIRGSAGDVQVRLEEQVLPGTWYAATCSRSADSVELTVMEYGLYGRTEEFSVTQTGPTGTLAWPKAQTPVSVGGKLAADGQVIRSATDQFNGLVTAPFLTIQD